MLMFQIYCRLIQAPLGAPFGPSSRKRETTMSSADFCLLTLYVAVQAAVYFREPLPVLCLPLGLVATDVNGYAWLLLIREPIRIYFTTPYC